MMRRGRLRGRAGKVGAPLPGENIPTAVWILLAVALVVVAGVLVDLARHEVRHLPKWVWAIIIILSASQ